MDSGSFVDTLPTGVAVVDAAGRFVWINVAGAHALGFVNPDDLSGVQSPFDTAYDNHDSNVDGGELSAYWDIGQEDYLRLVYQFGEQAMGGTAVTFRDVTEQRRQQARVAALARTAASMASQRSLATVLDAMAHEVLRSEGVAGTQFITVSGSGKTLEVMGSAGFAEVHTFFDLLIASHRSGAALATFEVMDAGRQIVYPQRREKMLVNPDWLPLHKYISELDWEDFVCTPLVIRGKSVGVLNVYMEPNYHAGSTTLDFFTAMAEQASLAVDYSTLLERDRIAVRREERKRLARDLHDSVVQQVFSIGMQARALKRTGSRTPPPWDAKITSLADEIADLSQTVQRDLRGIVLALQPSISAELGLTGALHLLADEIARRTDVRVDLTVDPDFPEHDADFVEDVYQVVSESIHNAVKHGDPTAVRVALAHSDVSRTATVDVFDDGTGPGNLTSTSGGYGLTSMRERVGRWAGRIQITTNDTDPGTHVHATLLPPAEPTPRGKLL